MNKVSPRPSRCREVLGSFAAVVPPVFVIEVDPVSLLAVVLPAGLVVAVFGRLLLVLAGPTGAVVFAGLSGLFGRVVRKAPRTSSSCCSCR